MEIRSLAGVGWDVLAAAFNAAFSDYAVAMAMTPSALADMQIRRGYVAASSFGAYDGDELVGFVLTCRDGDRIYNSGTGVIPGRRRGGLARALLDAVTTRIPAASYVLEVLESNTRAIALYQAAGFTIARRLQCWTFARSGDGSSNRPADGPADRPADLPAEYAVDLAEIAASAEIEPAWQNSLSSLRRASEPWVMIGDEHGAAVVFPGSADLPLLTVAHDARRRGRGTRLLAAAAAHASRPLRILNVDERAKGIAAFLAAAGAAPTVRQFEMIRVP